MSLPAAAAPLEARNADTRASEVESLAAESSQASLRAESRGGGVVFRADSLKGLAADPVGRGVSFKGERGRAAAAPLDTLFDGREERAGGTVWAEEVEGRIAGRGIGIARVRAALEKAGSVKEAVSGLEEIGALASGEVSAEAEGAQYLLHRLWTSASLGSFQVESDLPVESVAVKRGETTFHIHGVIHGQGRPARGRKVRRLAARLKALGRTLYSEEGFSAAYGYFYGSEIGSRDIRPGTVMRLRRLEGLGELSAHAVRRAARYAAALPVLGAGWWLAVQPGNPWAWAAAAAVAGLIWLIATSGFPLLRLYFEHLARNSEEKLGDRNMAEHLRAYAAATFTGNFSLGRFLANVLPARLGDALDPAGAARTAGMAEAVLRAKSGARDVHILTGANNVPGLAERLSA